VNAAKMSMVSSNTRMTKDYMARNLETAEMFCWALPRNREMVNQ
jgi:hypothetical protein